MLYVDSLYKSFGNIHALCGVSFHIEPGQIYGLLGPNGAGKTTTMRIMSGLLTPDSGTVQVAGYDMATQPEAYRHTVGYVPDNPFLYHYLTGREYLAFIADLWQVSPEQKEYLIEKQLTLFSLTDQADRVITSYSHGMRQKIAMAGALLPDPTVLILDEPLTGFDPPSARFIKDFLRTFADAGHMVLLSTHILEVAQRMCDRIGIITNGRIASEEGRIETMTEFETFVMTALG